MSQFDFIPLYDKYPALIAEMKKEFNSHEFILRLAQQNQKLYVEALYAYRESVHRGTPSPFLVVHGILSKQLHHYPSLITHNGEVDSKDIFGQVNRCASWCKVK